MKNNLFILILIGLLCISCNRSNEYQIAEAKKEIVNTELSFNKMAKEKGIAEAFYFFAADSAVINRSSHLLSGKDSIRTHYQNNRYKNVSLSWNPDFVDVAASCDLGYTYGKYTFIVTDSTGKKDTSNGYFHTVWKKQKNGDWKFVWD